MLALNRRSISRTISLIRDAPGCSCVISRFDLSLIGCDRRPADGRYRSVKETIHRYLLNIYIITQYLQFFLCEDTTITHQGECRHVWKRYTYTVTHGLAHNARLTTDVSESRPTRTIPRSPNSYRFGTECRHEIYVCRRGDAHLSLSRHVDGGDVHLRSPRRRPLGPRPRW